MSGGDPHHRHGHTDDHGHGHHDGNDHGHQGGNDHGHQGGQDHSHHDGNDHGHGGSLWGRVRHTVSEVFGGHSHDAAEQVDDALEADSRGRRALWISFGVLVVTGVLQGVVVALSASVALLGDPLSPTR